MSTNTDPVMYCDKCGRPISVGRGYININGWIICGICEWEKSEFKEYFRQSVRKPDTHEILPCGITCCICPHEKVYRGCDLCFYNHQNKNKEEK